MGDVSVYLCINVFKFWILITVKTAKLSNYKLHISDIKVLRCINRSLLQIPESHSKICGNSIVNRKSNMAQCNFPN